jgi:hypothetical protein
MRLLNLLELLRPAGSRGRSHPHPLMAAGGVTPSPRQLGAVHSTLNEDGRHKRQKQATYSLSVRGQWQEAGSSMHAKMCVCVCGLSC